MKIIHENQEYPVHSETNTLTESIEGMLPFALKLSRSAEHEYYASLPRPVSVDGAKSTTHVKAGWIYYFKDWNAFALNFREADIAPYIVYIVGEVAGGLEDLLAEAGDTIEIKLSL